MGLRVKKFLHLTGFAHRKWRCGKAVERGLRFMIYDF
jgi:hypothetical protein